MGQLASLDVLGLSNNLLTGEIPPGIGAACRLAFARPCNNNQLTGEIPPELELMIDDLVGLNLEQQPVDGAITCRACFTVDFPCLIGGNQPERGPLPPNAYWCESRSELDDPSQPGGEPYPVQGEVHVTADHH